MKKFLLLLTFIALMFTGCSDDDNENNASDCELATNAATNAATNLPDTDASNYGALCVAYKQALENWKDACGDDGGTIQDLIDDLGDCDDDTVAVEDCTICSIQNIDTTYCDNGDGTITVFVAGQSTNQDLGGLSFDAFIAALEQGGASCNN